MKKNWIHKPFFAELHREIEKMQVREIWVACSGGSDSVALLEILLRLHKQGSTKKNWKLGVLHIHHGPGDRNQEEHRDQAYFFTENIADTQKLLFASNVDLDLAEFKASFAKPLQSEAEFRKLRQDFIGPFLAADSKRLLAVAHHLDDQLETRLLQLIRGTGVVGLQGMKRLNGQVWRPLLNLPKSSLSDWTKSQGIESLDDPSNLESHYLRNWLRREWLPLLEQKRPGTSAALSRSLENLARTSEILHSSYLRMAEKPHLDRKFLNELEVSSRQNFLSAFLRAKLRVNYRSSHVNELLKRLDTRRKDFTFNLAGLRWVVNAERVVVEPAAGGARPKPMTNA